MCAGIDVTRDSGTADLQELLPPQNIDLLVIAAGAQQLDHANNVTRQGIRDQFEVNALGPLFAVLELRSRLQKGSKVSAALHADINMPPYAWPNGPSGTQVWGLSG